MIRNWDVEEPFYQPVERLEQKEGRSMPSNSLHAYVRVRIEEARILSGFNKAEMADRLGLKSPASYFAIESGKRELDIRLLKRIADITERKMSFFLPFREEEVDLAEAIRLAFPWIDTVTLSQMLHMLSWMAHGLSPNAPSALSAPNTLDQDETSTDDIQDTTAEPDTDEASNDQGEGM